MDERFKISQGSPEDRPEESEAAGEKLRLAMLESAAFSERIEKEPPLAVSYLFKRYGVVASRREDQLDFRLKVNGEDRLLFSVERTEQGLSEADRQLKQLVETKQQEIEKKYGVAFSKEGEDVDKQWVRQPDGSLAKGETIKSRAPQFPELLGIEAALSRSEPSHIARDGKERIRFSFLTEPFVKGESSSVLAYYLDKDPKGRPAVYFAPAASVGRLVTEKDIEKWGSPEEYSIESLLVHELAHNSQRRLDWDNEKNLEQFSNKMGWYPYEDDKTHETIWLIKTRGNDFYRFDPEKEDWIRCNKKGQFVDGAGKIVAEMNDAARATTQAVRAEAEVRPPTDYFDNAVEMHAEAMMLFRVNNKRRAFLLIESPHLYSFVKEQDQLDVNKAYGVDQQGKPRMIRNPDGFLVANSPENRRLVEDFERATRGIKQ